MINEQLDQMYTADESVRSESLPNQLALRQDQQIVRLFGENGLAEIHNFDGNARNQWRLRALACGGSGIKGDDCLDIPIDVKYVFCHRIEIEDRKTGEVSYPIRTSIITPSGDVYCWVSDVVAKDVAGMLKAFGCVPFDPPLTVKCIEVKTSGPNKIKTLVPV
jgi:hypothetical protein